MEAVNLTLIPTDLWSFITDHLNGYEIIYLYLTGNRQLNRKLEVSVRKFEIDKNSPFDFAFDEIFSKQPKNAHSPSCHHSTDDSDGITNDESCQFKSLYRFVNLKSLILKIHCKHFFERGLDFLRTLPSTIEHLSLETSFTISQWFSKTKMNIDDIHIAAWFPRLKFLQLESNHHVDPESTVYIEKIISTLPDTTEQFIMESLVSYYLSRTKIRLPPNWKSLRFRTSSASPEYFQCIPNHLIHCSVDCIMGSTDLSDQALSTLAQTQLYLEHLAIQTLDSRVNFNIINSFSPTLHTLELHFRFGSRESVMPLDFSMLKLKTLVLMANSLPILKLPSTLENLTLSLMPIYGNSDCTSATSRVAKLDWKRFNFSNLKKVKFEHLCISKSVIADMPDSVQELHIQSSDWHDIQECFSIVPKSLTSLNVAGGMLFGKLETPDEANFHFNMPPTLKSLTCAFDSSILSNDLILTRLPENLTWLHVSNTNSNLSCISQAKHLKHLELTSDSVRAVNAYKGLYQLLDLKEFPETLQSLKIEAKPQNWKSLFPTDFIDDPNDVLAFLPRSLTKLYLPSISDEVIPSLPPRLIELEVNESGDEITSEGLDKLPKTLQKLIVPAIKITLSECEDPECMKRLVESTPPHITFYKLPLKFGSNFLTVRQKAQILRCIPLEYNQ